MNFKRFFIILPIVVLTGCTTVREARKVQRGEDSPIGERMPTAAELGLTADKAATLADLEEVALKANPTVRKAVNGVNMAFLAIKIKKADFLPMITASAGHSRTTRNTNKHNYDYDTVGTYNAGINLDLMIFDFGKTNAAVKQSLEEYKEAVQNLRSVENGVITANEWIYAPRVYADQFYVEYGDTTGSVNNHTHFYTVNSQTGEVTPGRPDFTGTSHPFNIADTQYFRARVSAITPTAITAARETADANIYWDAANHTLSADYTLTAKNAADSPVYNERQYTITIPADKAYQAGYADGGGGGTHAVTFGTLAYAVGTDLFKLPASCGDSTNTFNMTPSLGWSGAPNEWNTPQTNWMRVWRYIDLNGVASKDFAIDVDMSSQISAAYNRGEAVGWSNGEASVSVNRLNNWNSTYNYCEVRLSNGRIYQIQSNGTIREIV